MRQSKFYRKSQSNKKMINQKLTPVFESYSYLFFELSTFYMKQLKTLRGTIKNFYDDKKRVIDKHAVQNAPSKQINVHRHC